MSLSKICKEIERLEKTEKRTNNKVVLLSDSKGSYLKSQLRNTERDQIEIITVKGATARTQRLTQELFRNYSHESNPTIIIWLGTCELTYKTGNEVKIDESVNKQRQISNIIDNYTNLKSKILEHIPNANIIFLECPYYSIERWNKTGINTEQDKKLKDLVDNLNSEIALLNSQPTPRVSQDQIISNKSKGKKTKYKVNYNTLTDGIHPGRAIARLWLLKLLKTLS